MQYLYEFIMCALLKSSNIDSELTVPEIDLNQCLLGAEMADKALINAGKSGYFMCQNYHCNRGQILIEISAYDERLFCFDKHNFN